MHFNQSILSPQKTSNLSFEFLNSLKEMDCFSISKSRKDLEVLGNLSLTKWMSNKNFIVFGTGGSSLGGQSIHAIFKNNKNIRFVNNLDPSILSKMFLEIDPNDIGFLCISKSGETLEVICQVLLAVNFMKLAGEIKDKFVVITENKRSSLKEMANEFGFTCLDHPATIGGRFSVFSIVGMLPAFMCGLDPLEIRFGGNNVLENHLQQVSEGASFIVEGFRKNLTQHVSFIYSDKLRIFGAWLAQLYAESTGKSKIGITPITAVGSVDQHSQLQLYLDGREDKIFTFFWEKQKSELKISEDIPSAFFYLKNKGIADIFTAQCDATIASVLEKNLYLRKIEIPQITPAILGELFMHFMLEVVCCCELMEINPFDQPAVERGKFFTKNLLSANSC